MSAYAGESFSVQTSAIAARIKEQLATMGHGDNSNYSLITVVNSCKIAVVAAVVAVVVVVVVVVAVAAAATVVVATVGCCCCCCCCCY